MKRALLFHSAKRAQAIRLHGRAQRVIKPSILLPYGVLGGEPAERFFCQLPELVERRSSGQAGRFRATSVKMMLDGVAENHTAAMLEP